MRSAQKAETPTPRRPLTAGVTSSRPTRRAAKARTEAATGAIEETTTSLVAM